MKREPSAQVRGIRKTFRMPLCSNERESPRRKAVASDIVFLALPMVISKSQTPMLRRMNLDNPPTPVGGIGVFCFVKRSENLIITLHM